MKKKKVVKKKLSLIRTTVRQIGAKQLQAVAGGLAATYTRTGQ